MNKPLMRTHIRHTRELNFGANLIFQCTVCAVKLLEVLVCVYIPLGVKLHACVVQDMK